MPLGSQDYREFLELALQRRAVSRRELARAIGRSESWVSYLMSGQRKLTHALIEPVAGFLRLSSLEMSLLSAMVDLENPSPAVQRAAQATIDAIHRQQQTEALAREHMAAFSRWYVPAILELARCEEFRADPDWIASILCPRIEPQQAREALQLLRSRGWLVEREGRLQPARPDWWSPTDLPPGELSAAAVLLHQAGLRIASEALQSHHQHERHVSSVVLALSEEQYPRLAARLGELERELLMLASEPTSGELNRVYMLGFNLFPVSEYTDVVTPS